VPSPDIITPSQLARLLGTPDAPIILDVRTDEDFARDPRTLPGALRRDFRSVASWAGDFAGRPLAIICQRGLKLSQGVAAWLRHAGSTAEALEGGFEAWAAGGGLLVRPDHVPPRDPQARTVWVTRARPKIDRIACPWLIRRFIDPGAVFLFVAPLEVVPVAERFGATPFDVADIHYGHRGEFCTFDVMVAEFGLATDPALARLARIVRGADTGRPELAAESAGLLAISQGLSTMHDDDLAQLEAGITVYDAMYHWCRQAVAAPA